MVALRSKHVKKSLVLSVPHTLKLRRLMGGVMGRVIGRFIMVMGICSVMGL